MAKRKDNYNDEKDNSLNAGAGNRNFDPYNNKKNENTELGRQGQNSPENPDDINPSGNDGNAQAPVNPEGRRRRSIKEEELKMPSATGDLKGNVSEGSSKSKTQVENELKNRMKETEQGVSADKSDGYPRDENYTPGKTASEKEPSKASKTSKGKTKNINESPTSESTSQLEGRAIKKEPAKFTQSPKGRFEDKSSASSRRGKKDTNLEGSSEEKINLPEHTSSSEIENKERTVQNLQQNAGAGNTTEETKGIAKTKAARSSTSPTTKKSKEKISPGPEVKGSGKKAKEKKVESKDTTITEDLKDIAMSTAAKIAEKIFPDAETRAELANTAMEILPDQEDIKKSFKKAKSKFSPEIEQVNKIVEKFISPDDIREKSEKVRTAAKNIKNKSQEKSEDKAFKEMSLISDYDVHLFKEGRHFHLYNKLGSHLMDHKG